MPKTLFFSHERRIPREQFLRLKEQLQSQLPDARVVVLEAGLKVKQMWTGDPSIIAKEFHDAYEQLAPGFGYNTRKESAVPWDDVPKANKDLMIATVTKLLEDGVIS